MNLANKITIARIMLIPLFILVFQQYPSWAVNTFHFLSYINQNGLYLAVIIFIVASITDKVDGYVARKYNQVTNLGKIIDPLADKLLISAALILMVQNKTLPAWIAFIIIGRELMVSGIRVLAAAKGKALAADKHGKIKMVLQVVGIAAMLSKNFPFSYITDFPVDLLLMMAAAAVTVYSGYRYFKNNYRELILE